MGERPKASRQPWAVAETSARIDQVVAREVAIGDIRAQKRIALSARRQAQDAAQARVVDEEVVTLT